MPIAPDEMFLCSSCKTEQPISAIIWWAGDPAVKPRTKECYCPNCRERCCDDYCAFFSNGRWVRPDLGLMLTMAMPVDSLAGKQGKAREQAEARNKARQVAYDVALERYKTDGVVASLIAPVVRDYEQAMQRFTEEYEATKRAYGLPS